MKIGGLAWRGATIRMNTPQLVLAAAFVFGCAVVAAALNWWVVALVIVSGLQSLILVAIVDTRRRMVRSKAVRDVSRQAKRANGLVEILGARLLAAIETSRVEVSDRFAEVDRSVDGCRAAVTGLAKNVADVQAGIDAWRSQLDQLRGELRASQVATDDVQRAVSGIRDQAVQLNDAVTQLHEKTDKREFAALVRMLRQTEALIQLYGRIDPRRAMPPSGGWGLDPTGVLTLIELVQLRRPGVVVELGSGTSTVWLGYALEKLGAGKVISLDHDESYASRTHDLITTHALESVAEVRLAPLVESGVADHEPAWYDLSVIDDLDTVDLLVVDGPPKATGELARFPALPRLFERLAPGASVVLDDATRADEREVFRRWVAQYPTLRELRVLPGDGLRILEVPPSPREDAL